MRIDRVVTPSGLIARARTFTLVSRNDGFFALCTGNAMNEVHTSGVSGALANKMIAKMATKLEAQLLAAEAQITSEQLEALAKKKHSMFVASSKITSVDFKTTHTLGGALVPVAIVRAKKKLKFHFRQSNEHQVREFFQFVGAAN